jgi:hypothetical protein
MMSVIETLFEGLRSTISAGSGLTASTSPRPGESASLRRPSSADCRLRQPGGLGIAGQRRNSSLRSTAPALGTSTRRRRRSSPLLGVLTSRSAVTATSLPELGRWSVADEPPACPRLEPLLHIRAKSRGESMPALHTCEPIHCRRCGRAIHCGEWCIDELSGSGSNSRRWLCGVGYCTSGIGRGLTYHCSTACYWRHRRARLRELRPSPRCARCRETFEGRRDARYCSSACRQGAYRQRGTQARR